MGQLNFTEVGQDYCVLDQDCLAVYGFPTDEDYINQDGLHECSAKCLNSEYHNTLEALRLKNTLCDPRVEYEEIRCHCQDNKCVNF